MYRTADNSIKEAHSEKIWAVVRKLRLLCLGLLTLGVLQYGRAQSTADEYQVKAAFLFHFAQLVEWPTGALNAGDQPITLCILADEAPVQEWQGTLEGKLVGTHVLHVRLPSSTNAVQGCKDRKSVVEGK